MKTELTAYAVCNPDSYIPTIKDGFRGSVTSAWTALVGVKPTKSELISEVDNWTKIGYKVKSFTIRPIRNK